MECDDVDTPWGAICGTCGQRLPNPGPVRSWKSQRELAFPSGLSAGMGDRFRKRGPRLPSSTAQGMATRRARDLERRMAQAES
jgi:hypothetical protein